MQITVVIPTYKRPKLLQQCLKALQMQSLNSACFEVLVVSDGPDEETAGVMSKFSSESNFMFLSLHEKKGPAAARNFGWQHAQAPVIAFTDDDCLPDRFWLENILHAADPFKAEAFTGKIIVPRKIRPTDYELNTAGLETAEFVTANCACTKLALEAAGGFDEEFSMAWREDSDLEFKLLLRAIPVKRIESAIIVHPVREAKWGISIKEQKKTLFNALLYRKYPLLYRRKIQSRPPYLYYSIIIALLASIIGLGLGFTWFAICGVSIWLLLTFYFIVKRLYQSSLSVTHILEMTFTSILIPFLSVYWQWYGAVKYKTLFL